MAGSMTRYGVAVIQNAVALHRKLGVGIVTVHGSMEMIKHQDHCNLLHPNTLGTEEDYCDCLPTGAWVDAGPAIQAMLDSGFLVPWVPKPGELDEAVTSLAKAKEDMILASLIDQEHWT